MKTYICFHNRRQVEIQADTTFQAQCKAAKQFGLSDTKRHMVAVRLAAYDDGTRYTHSTASV